MKFKFNKEKVKKYSLRTGTAIGALLLGLIPAYLITPARLNIIDLSGDNVEEQDPEQTSNSHFSDFIAKYTTVLDEGISGLHAEFEDFSLSFTTDGEGVRRNNTISIEGNIDFVMRNLKDMEINAMLDVDYNGRNVPITFAYTNSTVYLRLMDVGLKASSVSAADLKDFIADYIASPTGLNIDVETQSRAFDTWINSKLDLTSLISGLMNSEKPDDGTGIEFTTLPDTELNNGGTIFHLSLVNKEKVIDIPASENVDEVSHIETTNMQIDITTDADYNIERIDLGENGLKFGNFSINGALNVEMKPLTILPPDSDQHPLYDAGFEYVEVVNYSGWLRKLANLLGDDNKKMSLGFEASIHADKEENNVVTKNFYNVGRIEGSINLDAARLINLDKFKNGYVDDGLDHSLQPGELDVGNDLANKLLNAVDLGVNINLFDSDDNNVSNLDIKYVNEAGYITLNEEEVTPGVKKSVLKAKVETGTINWLIKELPDYISEITTEINDIVERITSKTILDGEEEEEATSLFQFILDSEVVTAIKQGEYAPIIDLIEELTNSKESKKINLTINLEPLGFQTGAKVKLVLDANDGDNVKVLSINAEKIRIGGAEFDLAIYSGTYNGIALDDASEYDSMSFIPNVVQQITSILNEKQVAFDLSGSVLDNNDHGLYLDGTAQFDYGTLNQGFGELTIDQYKYKTKAQSSSPWASHKITIDVDNSSHDLATNTAKFIYGDLDSDNIKGYFTMQSIWDIVKVIKGFIKNDMPGDPRYTKFTDMLVGTSISGTLSDIIANKNYLRLAKNDFIKEIKQYEGGKYLNIVVGGDILGLESDIQVKITFASVEERKLESLELVNFVMGQNEGVNHINVKLALKDYDPNITSPVPAGLDGFYNLCSIKQLLEFGINTTKLGYYHLHGTINLNALTIFNADIELDVKIAVDGKNVKLYGHLGYDLGGLISFVGGAAGAIKSGVLFDKLESEFTFHTVNDPTDPYVDGDVDGYFDIKKTVTKHISVLGLEVSSWNDVYHYRTTASNLIESENILYYLLDDLLDIKSELIGSLASSGDDEEKEPGQYTKMFTPYNNKDTAFYGYEYDESTGWHIGINLGNLVNNDSLREIDVQLTTQEGADGKQYLSSVVLFFHIQASLATVNISGTINLLDIDGSWTSETENKFNALAGVSNSAFGNKINDKEAYIEQ